MQNANTLNIANTPAVPARNRRRFWWDCADAFNGPREQRFGGPFQPSLQGGLHHVPKAKRVVQLFMNGGVSHIDTFDYKPALAQRHGEKVDFGIKSAATSEPGAIMKSPFEFKQYGECGRWVSSVFPHMAECVDEMAFLMAMASKTNVHGPASYMQNTGFLMPGFPCLGAWISYGLGNMNDNLPTFVVLPDPRGLPYNATGNFSQGFLPAAHQGTVINPERGHTDRQSCSRPSRSAKLDTSRDDSEMAGLELLRQLNAGHLERHPGDSRFRSSHGFLRIGGEDAAQRAAGARPDR